MNRTNIEWVVNPDGSQGFTWNPITGCLHGCEYCYARDIAKRFTGHFKPEFHPERLEQPYKRKKPTTIFVGSMSDMFGEWVEERHIQSIFNIVTYSIKHTFLFLTKNPLRYMGFYPPFYCWLGETVTNGTPIVNNLTNSFVSFEPLLGNCTGLDGLNWIIIGSLNKNNKPVPPEKGGTKEGWVEQLIEQADRYKIPVFIKDTLYQLYPDLPKRRELPYHATNLHS